MAAQQNPALFQLQKAEKPKIENIINTVLEGERKQNALAFVSFLRSLRMTPQWASVNSWAVSYKSTRVCYIKVGDSLAGPGSWYIRPAIGYNNMLVDFCVKEQLQEIMLASVHFCRACGRCAPGKHAVFFGKDLDGVCYSIDFEFHNPDIAVLDCAEKLVIFRRNMIAGRLV